MKGSSLLTIYLPLLIDCCHVPTFPNLKMCRYIFLGQTQYFIVDKAGQRVWYIVEEENCWCNKDKYFTV